MPPQAGYSERWLCSIFSSLPDNLAAALREACAASEAAQRQSQLAARDTFHNLTWDVLRAMRPPDQPAVPSHSYRADQQRKDIIFLYMFGFAAQDHS